MLYLKFVLICGWLAISFGTGFFLSLFRWGDTNLNCFTAGIFGRGVMRLLGIRLELEGGDQLEKHQPCVYVANHQGALDIATFGSIYPHKTIVIAKKEIAYVPVLNLYFQGAGNIYVDRAKRASAVASLGKVIRAIREKGASVWIFAEGTRNRSELPILPLKKGAFRVAIEAQVPIVPVISGSIRNLVDGKKLRRTGGTLRMKVLPPISTRGLKASDVDPLMERVRALMIEAVRSLSA